MLLLIFLNLIFILLSSLINPEARILVAVIVIRHHATFIDHFWCSTKKHILDILVIILYPVMHSNNIILDILLIGTHNVQGTLLVLNLTFQFSQLVLENNIFSKFYLPFSNFSGNFLSLKLHVLDFDFSLATYCFLPVGVASIKLMDKVLFLLFKILAHLHNSLGALLVLFHSSLNIVEQVLVTCCSFDLMNFNLCNFIFNLLSPYRMILLLELFSLLNLLLE